jgi:hypothetical protein
MADGSTDRLERRRAAWARRKRRSRQRQRNGLVTLYLAIDEADAVEKLVRWGYLHPLEAD